MGRYVRSQTNSVSSANRPAARSSAASASSACDVVISRGSCTVWSGRERRDQLAEPRACLAEDRLAVADEHRVDLEAGERLDALAEPRRGVHHLLAEKREASGRVAAAHGRADQKPARGAHERELGPR